MGSMDRMKWQEATGVEGDVIFVGSTPSTYLWWDKSANTLYGGQDDYGIDVWFFGANSGAYFFWDESLNKLFISSGDITSTSPGRQLDFSFAGTSMTAGQNLTGMQLSVTTELTATGGGATGAEIKARNRNTSGTTGQLRGVVANADTGSKTTTTAYALEASLDNNGGTITTGALIHANLNNSGTITNSYILLGEGTTGVYCDYGIYLQYVKRPFYASATLSGSSALNAIDLELTDSTTNSSGYTRGMYINVTSSGGKTSSGEINGLAIDLSVTTADCANAYIESHYLSQTGNKLTGQVAAYAVYMENVGTAAGNVTCLNLGRVATNTGSTRDSFIYMKQHSTTGRAKALFYLEGTNNYLAGKLFTFCGSNDCFSTTTLSGGIAGRLTISYESTPGGSSTTYYIPLYTS